LPELPALAPREVLTRQTRGEAVVDVRAVSQYAVGHIPGVYHVELRPVFASWVGWVVPFGTPVMLVSDATDSLEDAVRQLIRIGYDDLPGYLDGGISAWQRAGLPVASVPLLSMRQVRECADQLQVVDVRQAREWASGHVPGAELIEAGALPTVELRLHPDQPIALHCGHGQRAATGLSVLERRGYRQLALITEGVEEWRAAAPR
jgi:rhodanese-related sulfurtransferase